jgi:hypothetical protein
MSTLRAWLSPIVHLSSNWISRVGIALVTTATVLFLFLLPSTLQSETQHPYLGIAAFLVLPGLFFLGLALIPLGIWQRARRERRVGMAAAELPAPGVELRRLLIFVGVMTAVNVVLGAALTYRAVHYMDSVSFCGKACHSVMAPEYAAYEGSPHSRVACVACHIGPGTSWFVRSKLSGVWQVVAVTLNTYPRPIPTPIENLRPARDTCEACHWPDKFGADRIRILNKYADDEANTLTRTVLLMRIGGGRRGGRGIHDAHLGPGTEISYWYTDRKREEIPRVEYRNTQTGRTTLYQAEGAKPGGTRRLMDCVDCHNRPTHTFEMPDTAVNHALSDGRIPASLPFIKKNAVELLQKKYLSQEEAARAIPAAVEKLYPGKPEARRAGQAIAAIWARNVFPQMNVTWGTYPNNIGHTEFTGCFRCHDEAHTSSDGRTIGQDCNSCHQLLAQDEPAPKILEDLGLANK